MIKISRRSLVAGIFLLSGALSFGQTASEYEVKAVFVFNFLQFITWPENAFDSSTSPFVIGVLGKNVFENHLEQVTLGERYHNHPVVVRYYTEATQVGECHLLFVHPEFSGLKNVLDKLAGKHTLTVGDDSDFLQNGGMIRFLTEGNKIRIELYKEQIEKSKLSISSKLLRVATVYKK